LSTHRTARNRPAVEITLSTEALAMLDEFASESGLTRSRAVELLVRMHAKQRRK
jgi:hypothetical protein